MQVLDQLLNQLPGLLLAAAVLFLVFLALLWLLLPFAVFKLRELAREQVRLQERANELLERIAAQQAKPNQP